MGIIEGFDDRFDVALAQPIAAIEPHESKISTAIAWRTPGHSLGWAFVGR
jgi:hypothetical protein